MKRGRWLWWVFGVVCSLAIIAEYFVRPLDDLSGIMRLRPEIYHNPQHGHGYSIGETIYTFSQQPNAVLAAIPGHHNAPIVIGSAPDGVQILGVNLQLLSGRKGFFTYDSPSIVGDECELWLDDPYPWYQQAWMAIKRRLGF